MWSFFIRDPSKEFNYEILEQIPGTEDYMLWKLHKAKKKNTNELFSVFILENKGNSNVTQLDLGKAAIKRLKTLRHPNILTFVDSLETEKCLYLVTEYVETLQSYLSNIGGGNPKVKQQKELFIAWGFYQILRGITFLNNDVQLHHNSICLGNVLVNKAGEWKLGGFEYAMPISSSNTFPIKILPSQEKYDPPEKLDSSKNKFATNWSTDMWGLGCLIWEVYNGPLKSPSSLQALGNIPKLLTSIYCELVGANPSSRPNPSDILVRCRKPGGYFNNDLVDCLLFLEEIQIKETNEKIQFFNKLPKLLDSFPENLSRHKILPQIINAFEFGNAGSSVLAPMFKLGSLLTEEEYQKRIVPCVVKLFSSPDRATRVRLLQQLENFATHLLPVTVNDHIFPHILSGFTDSNPVIREHTVKSVIPLAAKLNYNNLNVEVLKHFARLQSKDDQGGIRTNTTVCLGKIALHLHPQIRQKVLVSAFTRATRDPFSPARVAGILAFAATQQYYMLNQISHQILPAMCILTSDPEREVRDQAFKVIKGFLNKLERVSEDPSLRESMEADVNTNAGHVTDAAYTWAGWAVNAVTSKFYKSQGNQIDSSTPNKDSSTSGTLDSDATPAIDECEKDTIVEAIGETPHWGSMNVKSIDTTMQSEDTGNGWEVEEDEWAPIENYEDNFVSQINTINLKHPKTSETIEAKTSDWDVSWKNSNWSTEVSEQEDLRKKREEKRIQRQKEIEAKRNARQGASGNKSSGSSLKLGGKKLGID